MIGWLLVLALMAPADEITDSARGLAIAEEAHRRDAGFGDTTVTLTMTLSSADGRTRTRRLTWQTLEVVDDGDKALTVFHEPRDIEGTAFLSVTHLEGEDEQWLFLPSLKRVKRISAANKTGAFVGSELSYEDLLSDEVARYDHRWLRDEPCALGQCFVVERVPRDPASGYSRQIVWLDQEHYRPTKTAFYDRKGEHSKTLILDHYQQYQERFWRAQRLHMTNHRNGKSTVLDFGPFEFSTGLSDREFNPAQLKRIR